MKVRKLLFVAVAALLVSVVGAVGRQSAVQAAPNDPFNVTLKNQCNLPDNSNFLGFPNWYKYLKGQNNPSNKDPKTNICRPALQSPNDIWLVVAAIFEIILRASGIAAVFYMIYAGFRYITSQGSPEGINAAKTSITNAITGLVLVVFAARLVGFIAGRFAGDTGNDFLLPEVAANQGALGTVINTAMQIAGGLSVVFIALGGVTYVRANGDPGTIKRAKEMIIYALVGLVVAIFASAIINFIFQRI